MHQVNPTSSSTFSGSERPVLKWIELPEDLAKWVDKNQEMVERVLNALSDTYDTLSDDQLWEAIAATNSPEWREAKEDLRTAELRMEDLNSPEKTSLGLIGSALDSDETNAAKEQHTVSLSHFTVINEGLRQREDLSRLLSVLLVQKRMLERSSVGSQDIHKTNAKLAFAEASTPKSNTPAEKPTSGFGIRNIFKKHSDRLFGPAKTAEPKKTPVALSPKA